MPVAWPAASFAAETDDPVAKHTTLILLKVDAAIPLDVATSFRERPPTIVIQFPPRQVIATIPDRSTVAKGIVQTIAARYGPAPSAGEAGRFLESLQIVLSAPYAHRVRSELGRIVVEIDHPVSVGTASVEVGLRGGTIITGVVPRSVTDRFRAMQEALARATPASWTLRAGSAPGQPAASKPPAAAAPSVGVPAQPDAPAASRPSAVLPIHREAPPTLLWIVLALIATLAGGAGAQHIARAGGWSAWWAQRAAAATQPRVPSGMILIDQLVWKAFERQGHQLIVETELTQPPFGTLRVIAKDGAKRALLFVGHGPFFEKQTVERFIRAMREVDVEDGLLVAAGSFTVPAQRIAKEHRVTLIGREQLTELLSAGAGSEYFAKQLEQQHARLEEAKETLQQVAGELDTLRRQRNEASWYLGEERARSAKLEAQLEEFHQQLRRYETDLQRWQQDATTLRKQWEENEWYLGESRERARHLESRLTEAEPIIQRVETAERTQQEASQQLGAERTQRVAVEARLAEVQQELQDVLTRERTLQETVTQLQQELAVFRAHGERRRQTRVHVPEATAELRNGKEGLVWTGTVCNLSRTGVGLECPEELPALPWFRMRIQIPGCDPIESKAQVRWQQAGEQSARYRSGCKFVGLATATRALIDELVAASPASSTEDAPLEAG